MRSNLDFDSTPFLVIWETTRACQLACRHCRAEAEPGRHPQELTTDEGCQLLDQVAAMGTPLVVFTGGDPLERADLEVLITHAKGLGLRVGTIPAATSRLTRERIQSLKESGVDQLALSLDASTQAAHDDFRRVEGSYAKTMEAAAWIRDAGVSLQFNTVFGAWNVDDFDGLSELVRSFKAVFWEVFFLVPTGRGLGLERCTPEQYELLFSQLYSFARETGIHVKVTEAPHYRRYVLEQEEVLKGTNMSSADALAPRQVPRELMPYVGRGVNSGKGYCFIDHLGNICPSGFLPLVAGNLRYYRLDAVYREAELFKALRDTSRLKGRCGRCPYRVVCGGSRARAYGLSGDYLAEEPDCLFEPG